MSDHSPTPRRPRRTRAPERPGTGTRVLATLVAWALRALGASWRVRGLDGAPLPMPSDPELMAMWHQDLLLAAVVWRDSGAIVPVSQSRDGDQITAVMRCLGLGEPPRGSSSRGGAQALRGVIEHARAGACVAVTLDGPRGPARIAKPGILAVARRSGRPVRPIAMHAWPQLRFRSWDRMQIALPFARVMVASAAPLAVPLGRGRDDETRLLAEIGTRLDTLHARLARAPDAGEGSTGAATRPPPTERP